MRKKYQEKENECEILEAEVVSLRKKQKREKRTIAFDNLLEILRSPLDKFCLGFQKGKSSFHAGKNTKVEPKKPVANNTSNKSGNQGNKK